MEDYAGPLFFCCAMIAALCAVVGGQLASHSDPRYLKPGLSVAAIGLCIYLAGALVMLSQ